jgi:hypothetical protein
MPVIKWIVMNGGNINYVSVMERLQSKWYESREAAAWLSGSYSAAEDWEHNPALFSRLSNGLQVPTTIAEFNVCVRWAELPFIISLLEALGSSDMLSETACAAAACRPECNVLELLRNSGCPWDLRTCLEAARTGNLATLQWALANDCPHNQKFMMCAAARAGHMQILEALNQPTCNPSVVSALCFEAACSGQLHVLHWAYETPGGRKLSMKRCWLGPWHTTKMVSLNGV